MELIGRFRSTKRVANRWGEHPSVPQAKGNSASDSRCRLSWCRQFSSSFNFFFEVKFIRVINFQHNWYQFYFWEQPPLLRAKTLSYSVSYIYWLRNITELCNWELGPGYYCHFLRVSIVISKQKKEILNLSVLR